MNRVLGLTDDPDEYQQKELFRVLAMSGLIVWLVITVYLIARVFTLVVADGIYSFDFTFLAAVWFVYSFYLVISIRKNKLDSVDVEEAEYPQKLRLLKRASVKTGLFFGSVMFIGTTILNLITDGTPNVYVHTVVIHGMSGVAFGLFAYFFGKSKLER